MASESASAISSSIMSWYDKATNAVPEPTIKGALGTARATVQSTVDATANATQNTLGQAQASLGIATGVLNASLMPTSVALSTAPISAFVFVPVIAAAGFALSRLHSLRAIRAANKVPRETLEVGRVVLPLPTRARLLHGTQMLLSGASAVTAALLLKSLANSNGAVDEDNALSKTISTGLNVLRRAAGAVGASDRMPVALMRAAQSTARSQTQQTLLLSAVAYALHAVTVVYGSHADKAYTPMAQKLLSGSHTASVVADVLSAVVTLTSTSTAPILKALGLAQALLSVDAVTPDFAPRTDEPELRLALASACVIKCIAVASDTSYGAVETRWSGRAAAVLVVGSLTFMNSRANSSPPQVPPQWVLYGACATNALVSVASLLRANRGSCPAVSLGKSSTSVTKVTAVLDLAALATACALSWQRRRTAPAQQAAKPSDAPSSPNAEWSKEFDFAEKTPAAA